MKKLLIASLLLFSVVAHGRTIIDGVPQEVTKLIPGVGISLSPTNGLGNVTVTATGAGGCAWAHLSYIQREAQS